MLFGSVSVYFANLRHVIRCKTCVSGMNPLFPETKVVKFPFYSIGPKMMFRSVSVHLAKLVHVKVAKLVFDPECTISWCQSCETSILVHWTENDVWESFRDFTNLQHVKRWKTFVLGPKCTILVVPKLWSLQSTLLDPKWCLVVFHCISLALCTLKDAKLVFNSDCTISGYQNCEAFALFHWTQHSCKRCKTCVRARMH
jgi:hypothetical protein